MRTHVEKNWLTANDKLIPFSEVTHQHWSNIYWYHLIFQRLSGFSIYGRKRMQSTTDLALKEIKKRFEGKILKWRPVYDFEFSRLRELGMLTSGTAIMDNGKKIGNILTCPVVKMPGME